MLKQAYLPSLYVLTLCKNYIRSCRIRQSQGSVQVLKLGFYTLLRTRSARGLATISQLDRQVICSVRILVTNEQDERGDTLSLSFLFIQCYCDFRMLDRQTDRGGIACCCVLFVIPQTTLLQYSIVFSVLAHHITRSSSYSK